jgi:hypothetical protein
MNIHHRVYVRYIRYEGHATDLTNFLVAEFESTTPWMLNPISDKDPELVPAIFHPHNIFYLHSYQYYPLLSLFLKRTALKELSPENFYLYFLASPSELQPMPIYPSRFHYSNKKCWEELFAYFPRYDTGHIENERVQQFFYCCVCIRYRVNVSTEPLPSKDKGIFSEPLPSNDKGDTQTHTDSNVIS